MASEHPIEQTALLLDTSGPYPGTLEQEQKNKIVAQLLHNCSLKQLEWIQKREQFDNKKYISF